MAQLIRESTGGGYNNLDFFGKGRFSYKRTRAASTTPHERVFLRLNARCRISSQGRALLTEFSCGNSCLSARIFAAKPFSKFQKSCVRASKLLSLASTGCFQPFGSVPETSTARFQPSKALLRHGWSISGFQENFCCLARGVSGLQKNFYCFPGVFSCFKSAFVAFLAQFLLSKVLLLPRPRCFRTSKELSLLSQRVFTLCECSRSPAHRVSDFREHSRGLPWVFSAFESSPTASPKVFSRFGSVFPGQS